MLGNLIWVTNATTKKNNALLHDVNISWFAYAVWMDDLVLCFLRRRAEEDWNLRNAVFSWRKRLRGQHEPQVQIRCSTHEFDLSSSVSISSKGRPQKRNIVSKGMWQNNHNNLGQPIVANKPSAFGASQFWCHMASWKAVSKELAMLPTERRNWNNANRPAATYLTTGALMAPASGILGC